MTRIARFRSEGSIRTSLWQPSGVRCLVWTILAVVACTGFAAPQQKRSLLTRPHDPEFLKQWMVPAAEWHPFPRASERKGWLALPAGLRSATIQKAEGILGAEWIVPRATLFLDYVRTGNRERYQSVSYGRRERLATLVLAECMEGKGRFANDIADGVWAICEESWWGVPAHLSLQKKGNGLPDVTEPTVDLFAAETGALLAWTSYLLPEALDSVSPLIRERIRLEVRRRIIDVNLERDDFWWMGFSRTVNNWNPWICSNWLTAVLLLEDDPARRVRSVRKILVCLDNFLDPYPADGGCDEGPTYWTRAGGSLFDCLELLHSASGGRIDLYANPLIREIGRYVEQGPDPRRPLPEFRRCAGALPDRPFAGIPLRPGDRRFDDDAVRSLPGEGAEVRGEGCGRPVRRPRAGPPGIVQSRRRAGNGAARALVKGFLVAGHPGHGCAVCRRFRAGLLPGRAGRTQRGESQS